ncbi:aldose epimerase family protein [Levilactobacillus bambusae]|uniref:Maltose epimerase n=1 Tax=Levilactobacillus bambusae TaxID=2024736 RepID=A0A2V1N1B3_9LACO|nr:aldose epimerase family protein [Levilactobacillus bambusae]PWG00166.1 galactose mutarotase [Levilactobacillus bambusae]
MTTNLISAHVEPFDTYNGASIHRYSLTNQHGLTVSAINLGATLYEILVPTPDGGTDNLVLNYPNSADYLANPFYVNMAIGRTAGRIGNGELLLNGQRYPLSTNEGSTTLHGGPNGFNSVVWEGSVTDYDGQPAITFTHVQKSSVDGYPGDLDVSITYTLDEANTIHLYYTGTALNQTTVFNPTQHTYFNLGHAATIHDHLLRLDADSHLAFNAQKVPTGDLIDVSATPFDLRSEKRLGDVIDDLAETDEKGFDDIWKINETNSGEAIATLSDPQSHRKVTVGSSRNGLVVFTANSFTREKMNFIRSNGQGQPYEGVALEAQTLPDATRHEGFGDVVLPAGESRTDEISYHVEF